MLEAYLVPIGTRATAKGDGEPVSIEGTGSRLFLLTLDISEIVEQESLEVSVFGASEGSSWQPKPLLSFPQKFYRGQWPLLLDLSAQPETKLLRAHWDVNRWGRGSETPMFVFSLKITEVAPELVK